MVFGASSPDQPRVFSLVLLSLGVISCGDSSGATADASTPSAGSDSSLTSTDDALTSDMSNAPSDAGATGVDVVGNTSRSLGATCMATSDCASSFCVSGHCCPSACGSPCSTCGSGGTCADVPTEAGTGCGAGLACDGLGNCRKTDGQSCASSEDCSSGNCIAGICGFAATTCPDVAAHQSALVQQPGLLERTWPLGNPAGQAVLVGGQFGEIAALCFDAEAIPLSYQDPDNAMVVLPATASVGAHSLTAIATSGAVATIPVNVAATFGTELAVNFVSAGGVTARPVFAQSASPFVPKVVGNYPPFDNTWSGSQIGNWTSSGGPHNGVYRDWDGGIGFFIQTTYNGNINTTLTGRRLSLTVHLDPANTLPPPPDAEAPATQTYVGLFVCGIDTPANFASIAASCGYPDGGPSSVVGNPTCQVNCDVSGVLRVLMFPDAPTGHQVVLIK